MTRSRHTFVLLQGLCLAMFVLPPQILANSQTMPIRRMSSVPEDSQDDDLATFDYAVDTIRKNFYDQNRVDQKFTALSDRLRLQLKSGDSSLPQSVNQLLKTLNASHTYYLTPDDVEFYRIASVFKKLPFVAKMFPEGDPVYPSLGLLATLIGDQWYVQDVLPNSEAEQKGLQVGDVLLTVQDTPFHPITAVRPYVDQSVELEVLRRQERLSFQLTVRNADPQTEFLEALKSSFRIREIDGVRVGYAHFYSYAGSEFQEALIGEIAWGKLASADVLILDLRYGMGGANLAYLNMFQRNLPSMTMYNADGTSTSLNSQWVKPAIYLIDETARSGKETIAYGAKKLGFATLVGTPTAGAVVGGSPFPMPNGDLLYLATKDVTVDGKRLEHNPVQPDHHVELDLKSCAGIDTQKEAAHQIAVRLVQEAGKKEQTTTTQDNQNNARD